MKLYHLLLGAGLVLIPVGCGRTQVDPLVESAVSTMRAQTTVTAEVFCIPPDVCTNSAVSPAALARRPHYRVTLGQLQQTGLLRDLASALKEARVRPVLGNRLSNLSVADFDCRWGIAFFDAKHRPVLTIYLDQYGDQGLINRRPVTLRRTAAKVLERRFSLLWQGRQHQAPSPTPAGLSPVLRSAADTIGRGYVESFDVFYSPKVGGAHAAMSPQALEKTSLHHIAALGTAQNSYLADEVVSALVHSKVKPVLAPEAPVDYRWGLVFSSDRPKVRWLTMYFNAAGTKALIAVTYIDPLGTETVLPETPLTLDNGDVVKILERRCSPLWK